jgi:hypothetical protein
MAPEEDKQARQTAAEAELAQRKAGPEGTGEQALKERAKDERSQQRAELRAGKAGETGPKLRSPAEQRTGRRGEKPLNGVVDNMTQRSGSDAIEGHFVTIDYSDKDVVKAVKNQLAPKGSGLDDQGFEPGVGSADYGTFLDVGETDEDGYPLIARVFLRDEHAAIINVPYKALRRSTAGGRR